MKTRSLEVRQPGSLLSTKLPLHPGCASLPTGEEVPAGFNLEYPRLPSSTLEPNFNGVACPPQSTVLGPIFLDSSAPALIGLNIL